MIKDNIKNKVIYVGVSPLVKKALDIAMTLDSDTPNGHYEVCKGLFYNVIEFDGKDIDMAVGENHQRFADIQMVLSGKEKIGYSPLELACNTTEYDESKDIAFWQADWEWNTLGEGDFGIYFPQDVHAPGVGSGKIKKAVFKIKLD